MGRKKKTDNQPEPDGAPVTGVWRADIQTLTYACPSCRRGKVHRGEAFRHGVVERCGCGSDNDVTVAVG